MKSFLRLLAHLVFILSLTSITFVILNIYNPLMGFVSSGYSKAIFLALCALAALLAVLLAARAFGRMRAKKSPAQESAQENTDP